MVRSSSSTSARSRRRWWNRMRLPRARAPPPANRSQAASPWLAGDPEVLVVAAVRAGGRVVVVRAREVLAALSGEVVGIEVPARVAAEVLRPDGAEVPLAVGEGALLDLDLDLPGRPRRHREDAAVHVD